MKIYIAGKITGLPLEVAKYNFALTENYLLELGHEPINPLTKTSEIEGKSWAEYMAEDFLLLYDCDAIYLMSNWQESKGARIEQFIAQTLGQIILYAPSIVSRLK